MNPASLVSIVIAYANRLKFRNLFFVVILLFVIDLVVPDFIPLFDELVLGLLAILLANWKKERKGPGQQGELIEGEVVDRDDEVSGGPG